MMTRLNSRIAATITVAALGLTGLSLHASAAPLYDPALNFGQVTVTLGDTTNEQTLNVPIGGMVNKGVKLVKVEGPAGIQVTLDSVDVSDNGEWLQPEISVQSEFLKGTGAGAYPVALTLEDANGTRCTFFITVMVQ
jgi:hypothetical protein